MKADALLALKGPEDLYDADPTVAKKKFLLLAREWHPDRNRDPRAPSVFAHIKTLYEDALARIASGRWQRTGVAQLTDQRKRVHTVAYRTSGPFELGWMYVGDDHVTYVVDAVHSDLWEAARRQLTSGFTYASDRMKQEVSRYLPDGCNAYLLADGRYVLAIKKTPDQLLLRDVSATLAPLDARHVAWVVSTMYNLACYFSHVGLVHHAFAPDTYFISPGFHSGALLGGWWYVKRVGAPVSVVPARTFTYLPWDVRVKKKAWPLTDSELILATGRELLGDVTGRSLDARAPAPMLKWLTSVASGTAIETYAAWGEVLTKSFGARRFMKMDLTADMVYRKPEERT